MNDIASPANAPLAKSFEPAAIEARWSQVWEARGYFAAALDSDKPAFSIQLPPPNVTGILHMGHAFNQTIMDALTRYHRMLGYDTLWLPGTDHAGIATQIVVERQLEANGIDRRTMGREAFTKQVWDWVEYSGGTITQQMRRLGASVDWSREYFTLDENLSAAVTEVFVRLYEQGLLYRGKRLANWDPVLKTAVSDLEVVNEEEEGKLYHLRYPLADGSGHLVVATTRPETMLGDTAVMVHPDDARYAHLRRPPRPLAARRARDPDHRRRVCRPRVRHRRRQGHAGTRLQRLRGRPAARPAAGQHLHARRDDQRRRSGDATADWTASRRAKPSSPTCRPPGSSKRSTST